MNVWRWFGLIVVALGLMGCQGSLFGAHANGRLSNHEFMALWDVYTHCRASHDPEMMRLDVKHLQQASEDDAPAHASTAAFSGPLKRLIDKPLPRLSADPRSMLASCAVQTGQAALVERDYATASNMFKLVLREYAEHDDPYYVREARNGLMHVGLARDLLLPARSIPVSSR